MAAVIAYEALATKYRPKVIEDLVGQDQIVKQFRGIMEKGRVARSYLISGPFGSGKTTTARLFARYLNCLNSKENGDPCGACKSCVSIDNGNNPDVHEINAADSRGIDDIRSIVNSSRYSPQSNFRIYIIDEVHQITGAAAAALLKPLEEPPARTIYCLCTTNPEKLLDTIVSRCQRINVKSVSVEDCTTLLARVARAEGCKKLAKATDILTRIAELTRGHPRNALHALEPIINSYSELEGLEPEAVDDMLQEMVEKAVGIPPWHLAANWLLAIYKNKVKTALNILLQVENYDYFLNIATELNNQLLYRSVAPKLCDSQHRDFLASVDGLNIQIDYSVFARTLPPMVATATQMKSYLVEARYLMNALTLTLLDIAAKAQESKLIITGKT